MVRYSLEAVNFFARFPAVAREDVGEVGVVVFVAVATRLLRLCLSVHPAACLSQADEPAWSEESMAVFLTLDSLLRIQ
jgi:hypothetical protein